MYIGYSFYPFSVASPTVDAALEATEGAMEDGPVDDTAEEKLGRLVELEGLGEVGDAGISGKGNLELGL